EGVLGFPHPCECADTAKEGAADGIAVYLRNRRWAVTNEDGTRCRSSIFHTDAGVGSPRAAWREAAKRRVQGIQGERLLLDTPQHQGDVRTGPRSARRNPLPGISDRSSSVRARYSEDRLLPNGRAIWPQQLSSTRAARPDFGSLASWRRLPFKNAVVVT